MFVAELMDFMENGLTAPMSLTKMAPYTDTKICPVVWRKKLVPTQMAVRTRLVPWNISLKVPFSTVTDSV